MNIGAASDDSGVSQRMVRHFGKIELVPAPLRRESGYRDYSDADVHRLQFIAHARDLGFSIEKSRRLLELWSDRERPSVEVKALAEARAAELQKSPQTLRGLLASDDCKPPLVTLRLGTSDMHDTEDRENRPIRMAFLEENSMISRNIILAAFTISVASATPIFAQMDNSSTMKEHEKGMMSSGSEMKMSKSQMATMKRCHSMSEEQMMKNKTCSKMMKMHPDMMKGDMKM